MANPAKRLLNNVPGELFVDTTCINCDTCRQLAPDVFDEDGDYSIVYAQPKTGEQQRKAIRALLACPTGSIGTIHPNSAKEVMRDFPMHIDEEVYYCGFNSPKSFGGNSYVVLRPGGNWLIDSPKFLPHLVNRFRSLGGIKHIFLTHRDDVADAERYASEFSATRIIHRDELSSQPDAETVVDGTEPMQLFPDFLVIPTPGHTRGHCALLYKNRFLFTGDHLWWSRTKCRLSASEDVCWYDWPLQIESLAALQQYRFEWILPGHGQRVRLPPTEMKSQLGRLLELIKRGDYDGW